MKHLVKIMAVAALSALCLFTSCDKHTPYRRTDTSGTTPGGNNPGGGGGNNPGGGSATVKAKLRTDWKIEYKGRENYTEENGYVSRVERFYVEAPGTAYYLVRTINPEVFQNNYGTDVIKFFKDEQGYLEQDAKNFNEKVTDYLYTPVTQNLLFDRIRHGEWLAFLIGFDNKGKITGEYARCSFTSQEDQATPDFEKWIGDWQISGPDPDGRFVTYNIIISSSEANYAYFVDKWETGESISNTTGTSMDGENDWFETFFEPSNGAMYFMSKYIQTYEENGITYDQFFFGNIYYNGRLVEKGEYVIPEENLDIAAAQMTNLDNTRADVKGCKITAYMTDADQTGTETQFTSMQYFADDGEQLLKFNLNVPQFPLTMVKTASGTHSAAIARKPASIRGTVSGKALRHHTQLRDVQRKDSRKAQHAVARTASGTVK